MLRDLFRGSGGGFPPDAEAEALVVFRCSVKTADFLTFLKF